MSVKQGQKTGILNSIVFHNHPAVDFGFAALSVMTSDGGGGRGKGC